MARFSAKKLLVLLFLLACVGLTLSRYWPVTFEKDELYIQSGTRMWPVSIELATSSRQQALGLMYRKHLEDNSGMLFVLPQEKPMQMWMKNTLIPLDMLFIDKRGRIIHIVENAKPQSTNTIAYDKPVRAILELPGGSTKKREIKIGDRLIYDLFPPYVGRN